MPSIRPKSKRTRTRGTILKAIMNGRTDPPPIKEWRKEFDRLTATKFTLTERYYALQDDVRGMERLIIKGADNIMQQDAQERQHTHRREHEH